MKANEEKNETQNVQDDNYNDYYYNKSKYDSCIYWTILSAEKCVINPSPVVNIKLLQKAQN